MKWTLYRSIREENHFLRWRNQKESSDIFTTFTSKERVFRSPSCWPWPSTPFPLFPDLYEPADSILSLNISLMLDLLDRLPSDPLLLLELPVILEWFSSVILAE